MNEFIFPLMLVLLASLFRGTFGLGMKYIQPLAWEAWWVVHATVAMLLFPWIWALLVVPHLCSVITHSPGDALFRGALFGFLWGVGGIMFGVSVRYVGVSLTYGIVMGLAALMGSLVLLLQNQGCQQQPRAAVRHCRHGTVARGRGDCRLRGAAPRRRPGGREKKAADIQ